MGKRDNRILREDIAMIEINEETTTNIDREKNIGIATENSSDDFPKQKESNLTE